MEEQKTRLFGLKLIVKIMENNISIQNIKYLVGQTKILNIIKI